MLSDKMRNASNNISCCDFSKSTFSFWKATMVWPSGSKYPPICTLACRPGFAGDACAVGLSGLATVAVAEKKRGRVSDPA